ncbi:MAG: ABC transporter permease [Chloroflexota bacterium]|nr:ABC transporter permease [Chloroflexota bacterium]MDE3192686.1 ABC transporter permease [Chloroflexota bacterium]
MTHALRVLRTGALLEARNVITSNFMLFCVFVQPFFIGVTVMFMLRHRPDFDPVYVVVGTALSGIWSAVLFEGNWIIGGERRVGTLELLVASPTPLLLAIGGRLAGSMGFSVSSVALAYVIVAWLFGAPIRLADAPGFALSTLLAVFALWCTGMLLAPLGVLARTISRFVVILEYPVYALSGFLFPILLLPGWTNPISLALPPFWAAQAMHMTSSGEAWALPLAAVWAILLGTGLTALLISVPLFSAVLRRARVAGTLSLT